MTLQEESNEREQPGGLGCKQWNTSCSGQGDYSTLAGPVAQMPTTAVTAVQVKVSSASAVTQHTPVHSEPADSSTLAAPVTVEWVGLLKNDRL